MIGENKTKTEVRERGPETSGDLSRKETGANGDASIWADKGNKFVESSMYADAVRCYDKALEINPKSVVLHNNRGLALARTGRLGDAIESYQRALEIKPGDTEVLYNKGIALAQMGKVAEALACYNKLIDANPKDANAWCSKGDVLFESLKYEEALKAYDVATTLNPKDETAWNNRGLTLVKFNRYEDAIESYDKALEINPRIEKIWTNKGLAIAKRNETKEKEKIDLLKIAGNLPKEERSTPQAKPGTGEPAGKSIEKPYIKTLMERTRPVFEKPNAFQPEKVPEIEAKAEKPETTRRKAPRSLFEKPADISGAGINSPASLPDNSPKEEKQPPKPESLQAPAAPLNIPDEDMGKGISLFSEGKYEEALESFTKAVEKNQKNKAAWNNKGLALGKLGRVYEAIGCYEKALEIAPKDHIVLNNKGTAFYKKGRVNEALQCFQTSLGLDPGNKTATRGIELCNEYLEKSSKKNGAVPS